MVSRVMDQEGIHPLWAAAGNGHVEAVKLLMELGGSVHMEDADGDSPVWAAAKSRHADVLWLLLGAGANPQKVTAPPCFPLAQNPTKGRAFGFLPRPRCCHPFTWSLVLDSLSLFHSFHRFLRYSCPILPCASDAWNLMFHKSTSTPQNQASTA